MKATVNWNEGMLFHGLVDNHTILMDAKAPIGKNQAATPKELVALGLGGCTAMDVVAFLKKYKQNAKKFSVTIDVEPSKGPPPIVFEKAVLSFHVEGEIEKDKLIEAVHLSQSKYCGVSAMLAKALPIEYQIILNGITIGKGAAHFANDK